MLSCSPNLDAGALSGEVGLAEGGDAVVEEEEEEEGE